MNLPFDSFICAGYIRSISHDILPENIRAEQERLKVPCLGVLGCRILSLCASMVNPKTVIDIGCGIGASTVAIHKGAPQAKITAIDANKERARMCSTLTAEIENISVFNELAVPFLENTDEMYDMAFVDSVKKSYLHIWQLLKKRLNPGAAVIFDDVLLYGYTAETEATVPTKYADGSRHLREFLECISKDKTLLSQVIPVDGGMLLVKTSKIA